MSQLGVGIIGAGWVAEEHIRAYVNNPHTTVRGIADVKEDHCHQKAKAFGLTDVVTYTDPEKMLKRDDIQIISICSPPNFHAGHIIAAAEAGKHIAIEKPATTNWEDLKKARDAVAKAGVSTVVSFVLRWNPLFQTIRRLLDENAIGNLFFGTTSYFHGIGPWYGQYSWNITKEAGGSSLLSGGCHALDGLLWFMGSEVVEVSAFSTKSSGEHYVPYEYDPTNVLVMKLKNGGVAQCNSCIECVAPYMFPILLCGDAGTIRDNKLYSKNLFPGQTDFATIPTIQPDSGDVSHHPFQGEIDELVEVIRNGGETQTNLANSAHVFEVIFAADKSAAIGEPVKLPLA